MAGNCIYYNIKSISSQRGTGLAEEDEDDDWEGNCRENCRDNDEFGALGLVAAVFLGEEAEGSSGWESLN